MRKKLLWALALVLAALTFCAAALAAESGSCGELSWSLDDEGLLTISGSGEMPNFL